jgi:Na+-transporting NADH:ubiquinone oxidoreductase subunit E
MVERNYSFAETVVFGAGSGEGWCLAIIAMAAIQKKLRYADVRKGLQGFGLSMIVTGLIAMGFLLFAGISV